MSHGAMKKREEAETRPDRFVVAHGQHFTKKKSVAKKMKPKEETHYSYGPPRHPGRLFGK